MGEYSRGRFSASASRRSMWLLVLCGLFCVTSSGKSAEAASTLNPSSSSAEDHSYPTAVATSAIAAAAARDLADTECALSGIGLCSVAAAAGSVRGANNLYSGNAAATTAGIRFRPELLEYADSPVCIPTISEFTLDNEMDSDVHVYSISSDSSQFHPVSFQPQVLLPNDSLNIQLLFLPYHVKATDAILTISTSVGDFEYRIIGKATSNPYNLHPFIGNKVIAGVPFEQPIVMFNPHDSVLHIREIFTTEEFLSLHRSGSSDMGDGNGPSNSGTDDLYDSGSWELEAGGEKEVIRLAMVSTVPGHYYGYVHVKTDKDKIVIPVDLHVLEGGLRAFESMIDFGVITQSNAQKSVELKLVNSGSSDVTVMDVVPSSPDPQLSVEMRSRLVRSGMEEVVAMLVYNGGKPGKFANKVLVTTDNSNAAYATLEVPYEVSVLQGGIGFNFNQSVFAVPIWNETKVAAAQMDAVSNGSVGYQLREIVFTNFFSVPVSMQGISAATCNNVITLISVPPVLSANRMESWDPVVLLFNISNAIITSISKDGLPFTCWLELWTNISSHRIPLHVLDGDLNVKLLNDKALQQRKGSAKKKGGNAGVGGAALKDNSDIHVIDFKTLNLEMPEGLLFSIENVNPQRIPLYLSNSTSPVCICVEAVVVTEGSKTQTQIMDTLFPGKFVSPKTSFHPNCTCYGADGAVSSTRQVLGSGLSPVGSRKEFKSTFGAFLNTDELNDGDVAAFDLAGRGHPLGQGEESLSAGAAGTLAFLRINAGHTAYLSVHFLELAVGDGTTVFGITSPYQSKIFSINYTVVDGKIRLRSRDRSEQGTTAFVMGRYQYMDILASSTFGFPLPIRALSVASPHFSVPAELSLPNLPAKIRRPPQSVNEETEQADIVIGGLVPDFSCVPGITSGIVARAKTSDLNRNQVQLGILPMSEVKSTTSDRKYPIWSCIRNILSKANVAVQRMSEGVGIPGAHDIGAALDYLDHIESALRAQEWSAAHDASLALSDEWERLYPDGFSLRPFNVTLATDAALSSVTIKGLSVLLPSESLPPSADIILPPTRVSEANEFYIKVVNPFDLYLSFSLADSDGRNTPAMKGPISSPTVSPSAVPTTGTESRAHLDFVPAVFPKSWVPHGCHRYFLHTADQFRGAKHRNGSEDKNTTFQDREDLELEIKRLNLARSKLDLDLAELRMKIKAIKSVLKIKSLSVAGLNLEEAREIDLLTEKLGLLREIRVLNQMLMLQLTSEGADESELVRLGAEIKALSSQFWDVKDTLLKNRKDLQTRDTKAPKAAKNKESKAETVTQKSFNSINVGGIVEGKAQDALEFERNPSAASSVDLIRLERKLKELSIRYKYAEAGDTDVMQFSRRRCRNTSLGWCGFVDSIDDTFKYPAECEAWAALSDTPASSSPIVTGALLNRRWPSTENVIPEFATNKDNEKSQFPSPFVIIHAFPHGVVLAPHSSAYIGPIKFESALEGIFHKTIFVLNNYTGTDKVNLIAEAGSSLYVLSRAVFLPNQTTVDSPLSLTALQQQTFLSTWDPAKPFGSSPLVVNGAEGEGGILVKNEGVSRIVGQNPQGLLEISDTSGSILYTFHNFGILTGVITDIKVNGQRLCESPQSSLFSELCRALPYSFEINSSWTLRVPYFIDCSFASSEIEIQLISNDTVSGGSPVYEMKHSTSLSPSMIDHCLLARGSIYSDNKLLQLLKFFMLIGTILNAVFFWRKLLHNRSMVSQTLSVDGQNIFGGVSEIFIKQANDETEGSSQRGRKATALGSASALDKKKSRVDENSEKGGICTDVLSSSGTLAFEDIVRPDDIDESVFTIQVSPALRCYDGYLLRRAEAMSSSIEAVMPDSEAATVVTPVISVETKPTEICTKAVEHEINLGTDSNTSSSGHKVLKSVNQKQRTRPPEGKIPVMESENWSDQQRYGNIATMKSHTETAPAPTLNDSVPFSATGNSQNYPVPGKAEAAKRAPPGIAAPTAPHNWGDAGLYGSFVPTSDGDLDFDPSDFNSLIDQDLRALLVKPPSKIPTLPPPGFDPVPMHKLDQKVAAELPQLSIGRDVSGSFQQRFIDDLLLDDMSPLASDPSLKSFFSGMAAPHSHRTSDSFFGHLNEASQDHAKDHPYSSILNLLDTDSLPLSLSSESSPVNGPSPKFHPKYSPKVGGPDSYNLSAGAASTSYISGASAGMPPRGILAAALTRPGDVSPAKPAPTPVINHGASRSSQYPALNSFSYPPLTLDTSVGPAKVLEQSSGGRYPTRSPISSSGLPLAAALPPFSGAPRPTGSSPRIVGVSGPPPGLSGAPPGIQSRLGADIRSQVAAAESSLGLSTNYNSSGPPPGLAPHRSPPGLSSAPYHSADGGDLMKSIDSGAFFGENSFFGGSSTRGRSNSKGSSLSDDVSF